MSSRTPEECVELALDDSASADEREGAIHELELANECDELAALVRDDGLDDGIRQRALRALANPQCDTMLGRVADSESVEPSLREEARTLRDGLNE